MDKLAAGSKVGEYEVDGILGEGGMGVVYSGKHPVIGKPVAIKVVKPELASDSAMVSRFLQEARAVNQIGHRNIVDIFAFGELDDGSHYLVMEKLIGEPLVDLVGTDGIALDDAIEILDQVVGAVGAAHDAGILHRDLKPDNVFVTADSRLGRQVKLLDFGLAKLTREGALVDTAVGVPMGTPMFMPPEQWRGIDVDHRADLYALGVMIHNVLTGRFPFEASTYAEIMHKHTSEEPTRLSEHGGAEALDPVVLRALAKNKEDRFQSTSELWTAIELAVAGPVLDTKTVVARGAVPQAEKRPEVGLEPATVQPKQRSYRGLALVVAVLALSSVIGGLVWRAAGSTGRALVLLGVQHHERALRVGTAQSPGVERKAAFVEQIAKELGRRFELRTFVDEIELAGALGSAEIDLGFLKPRTYIEAKAAAQLVPLVVVEDPTSATSYAGVIVVRADSDIGALEDLEDTSFCYPSQSSAGGYLYPRALLRQAGIDPDRFARVSYGMSHLGTLQLLVARQCDAAAVIESALQSAPVGVPVDQLKVVATTGKIPIETLVVGPSLDAGEVGQLRDRLLAEISGVARIDDGAFDALRALLVFVDAPR